MYQYQVSFGEAVSRAFSKYCDFTGRASRSEFWYFYLLNFIVSIGIAFVSLIFGYKSLTAYYILTILWGLITLLPYLGLMVRRLHDTGRSGVNLLWAFLPIAGPIVLLVFFCQDSQMFPNRFGDVPNLKDNNRNPNGGYPQNPYNNQNPNNWQ